MPEPSQPYVVLTREQADTVRGETIPGHRIEPVDLGDGIFVVPAHVIDAPSHAKHKQFLESLPIQEFPVSQIRHVLGMDNPITIDEIFQATAQETPQSPSAKPRPARYIMTKGG